MSSKIGSFFKSMFSGASDTSSKRVNGSFILDGTAIVCWILLFRVPEAYHLGIIIALFTTGGALFGLTIFEKKQNNQNNAGENNPT